MPLCCAGVLMVASPMNELDVAVYLPRRSHGDGGAPAAAFATLRRAATPPSHRSPRQHCLAWQPEGVILFARKGFKVLWAGRRPNCDSAVSCTVVSCAHTFPVMRGSHSRHAPDTRSTGPRPRAICARSTPGAQPQRRHGCQHRQYQCKTNEVRCICECISVVCVCSLSRLCASYFVYTVQ